MLWWIGRFRYTSVELLAMRFQVARQNIRVRLKRLAAGGLVRLERRSVTEPWVVSLTAAGSRAIGEIPRKRPRVELHQAHELAIGWLCARIETDDGAAGLAVLTERESRQCERAIRQQGLTPRYRIELHGAPRGQRTRWPDLVVERDGRPVRAFELEFTQKSNERLQRIIDAYYDGPFPEVVYLTADPNLAGTLARVIREQRHGLFGLRERVKIRVAPWPGAPASTQALVMAHAQDDQEDNLLGDDLDL